MTDQKHTKEPWRLDTMTGRHVSGDDGVDDDFMIANTGGYQRNYEADGVLAMQTANANRIVACVNALAGIDDPEAFMRDVLEYIKSPSEMGHRFVSEHLKGGAE